MNPHDYFCGAFWSMSRLFVFTNNKLQNGYSGLVGIVGIQDAACPVLTLRICCSSHSWYCPCYALMFLCVCAHNTCMIVRFFCLSTFPESSSEFSFLFHVGHSLMKSVLCCVSEKFVADKVKRWRDIKDTIFQIVWAILPWLLLKIKSFG